MGFLGALRKDGFQQAGEAFFQLFLAEAVHHFHPFARALDQPGFAQDAQVVGARGGRQVVEFLSHAGAVKVGIRAVRELAHHGETHGIAQCGEDAFQGEIGRARVFEGAHLRNIHSFGGKFNISRKLNDEGGGCRVEGGVRQKALAFRQ